jgi:hypothetical protein
MKSPVPLVVGWAAGAVAGASVMSIFTLGQLAQIGRFPPAKATVQMGVFWLVFIGIPMIPGVVIGSVVFYCTSYMRRRFSWATAGLIGVLIMWLYAVPFDTAFDVLQNLAASARLGSVAFTAASVFWYVTIKLEKPKPPGAANP